MSARLAREVVIECHRPEQVRDATSADQRSDIWSFGATLYHALCGRPPFEGESVGEILSGVLYHRVTEPRRLAPHLSRGISLVLRKCLAREPDQRYRTPAELLADLERLRERRSPAVRSANLDPVAKQTPRWRMPLILAGCALAVVLLVIWPPWQARPAPLDPNLALSPVRSWPAFASLRAAWDVGKLLPGDALVELALLAEAPGGWQVPKGELEQEVLADLEQRLERLETSGTEQVNVWLGDHEYEQARAFLGESVAVALGASTGCATRRDLPAGPLPRGLPQWRGPAQWRRAGSGRGGGGACAGGGRDGLVQGRAGASPPRGATGTCSGTGPSRFFLVSDFRSACSAAFTAIRCSHVEKRASPLNVGRARIARIHASCA